jgi:uncharacterized protein (TIGR02246 family)
MQSSTDAAIIRRTIERWVRAVDAADLPGVLAGHTDDVVMFDVPAPADVAEGIDAYAATWPPFLAWQAGDGCFELAALQVAAGHDVAYAHALLRCGNRDDLARDPRPRLRLTFGLRKQEGDWLIAHEHHSFPSPDDSAAETQVRALYDRWYAATAAKDLDALMAPIAADVVSYEHDEPLQYVGVDAVREVCRRGLDVSGGSVTWEVPELRVVVRDDLAVTWGLDRVRVPRPGGGTDEHLSRGTRVFTRSAGSWQLIHQHLSYPRGR